MVKIKSQDTVFDNGALDMAMNLLHIYEGNWKNKEAIYLDFRDEVYKEKSWELDHFENGEEFMDEGYPAHDLSLDHFTLEELERWNEENIIEFPLIKINSIKFYPDKCSTYREHLCLTIEIDSDNDEMVRKIFVLLAELANGGHCCGGKISINKEQLSKGEYVANFGLDGDGTDRIFYVNDEMMPL